VGLPVYNGQPYLEEAIESLLTQTYAHLELIISDNASTDGTEAICREAVRRDPRVRYLRQAENIGAPRNWNAVAREARGEYFKWASANDRCTPELLEKCIAELESDPAVVLCYGKTQLVDEEGQPIEVYPDDRGMEQRRPSERFAHALGIGLNNAQQGVIRTSTLMDTRLDRPFPAGDIALMAELALLGGFRLLDDVLLYRRHGGRTFTSMLDPVALHRVFDPSATSPIRLKRTRYYWDVMKSALRTRIPWAEKGRALRAALQRMWWERSELAGEALAVLRIGGGSEG
jgi:glycosyltransferase involved in cell wall biosynthesis